MRNLWVLATVALLAAIGGSLTTYVVLSKRIDTVVATCESQARDGAKSHEQLNTKIAALDKRLTDASIDYAWRMIRFLDANLIELRQQTGHP